MAESTFSTFVSDVQSTERSVRACMFDRTVAGLLGLAAMPLLLPVMLIIKLQTGKGPFFKQLRYGGAAGEIEVWKLLTMLPYEVDGETVDKVYSWFAVLLRKSRFDEVPQLIFNVCLFGNMALIGPRPMIMKDMEEHNTCVEARRAREKLLTGVTGLEQTQPSREEQRKRSDDCALVLYHELAKPVLRRTWFKVKVLADTVLVVLRRDSSQIEEYMQ